MSVFGKLLAAASLFLAPTAVAQAATVNVVGGETWVEVLDDYASLVSAPLGSAIVAGTSPLTAVFPISGGSLDLATFGGRILHEGSGLRLTAGGSTLELANFIIDTNISQVLGDVTLNGVSVGEDLSLFSFNLSSVTLGQLADVSNPQLGLFFTTTSASALNGAFGTDLAAGDQFGSAAVSVSLAAVPEPATWMLMIGGVAMTGAALRRRRLTVEA